MWLDGIIVPRGDSETHRKKLLTMLEKLQEAAYRASEKKSEFSSQKQLGWDTKQPNTEQNRTKIKAILQLKPPTSSRQLKSFLGGTQYIARFLPKLSGKTDRMRQALKKKSDWNWTKGEEEDSTAIKKMMTEIPCLAHFVRERDNIVTTDASRTGLGITLWQRQNDDTTRPIAPIAFASRYLNDAEKNYLIGESELLAKVWG